MPGQLLKIELPPGVSRQGTLYQTQGRWYDSNFVRWYQGSMAPIGGWAKRYTGATTGIPRAMHVWRSNDSTRFLAVGTEQKLYAATVSLTALVDITPVGFVTGNASATAAGGYGGGNYGASAYGTARTDNTSIQDADVWCLDNFGQYLVGCMATDGKAYEWQLDTGTPTLGAAITNAPTGNSALVVTPEYFVMLLGAGGNPRKIQWSDQAVETTWTASATNQAGSYTIQSNGRLMCGRKTRGQTLIWTDQDVHLASYIGLPYVYTINRVGERCGAISRGSVAVVDSRAYWMSYSGFFMWDGSAVQPIVSVDIWDAVFGNLNKTQRSKVTAGVNSQFSEVWFAFPSAASTENDMVAVYNYLEGHWALHTIQRTAIIDRGVFTNPIMADASGFLYDHENGSITWDSTPYATSGPFELGSGDYTMRCRRIIFDEKTQGDVSLTVYTSDWPNGTETTNGPYVSPNPVTTRFAGRKARQKVSFTAAGQWGATRFEVSQGGKR